jgi:trimethylamine---corrinoid protein Co-methyltransferase
METMDTMESIMDNTARAAPRIRLLTPAQVGQVHAFALKILARTGVRVDSDRIRTTLANKIGKSYIHDNIVHLPAEVVEWALTSAPRTIDLFDRRGQPAFQLGDGSLHFGIGVTALFYQDPRTDRISPFTRRNMQDMVRLGSRLPLYDVISTVGIVQDVHPALSDLYGSLELIANTTKPLVLLVSDENRFGDVLDLFTFLHGDLSTRPFILPYFNPVSPLVMNAGTVEKMELAIQLGLPVIFSNYSMAGASTPLPAAGTLALLMAELLAGLVISQVIKPGAPILLGMLPVYFDMKTMVNFYDPHSILLNLACAEMMDHYHLPHAGTSGSGTGWGADLIAADTYWMNTITSGLTRGGLAPFVGDTLTSKVFSPNTVVYVHEVIAQTLRLAAGFDLDDEHAVLDEIDRVGPGGSFLAAPSTRKGFKTGYYSSPIFSRWSLEKWQAAGEPQASSVLQEYTCDLIATASAPDDCLSLLARGEEFIAGLKLTR